MKTILFVISILFLFSFFNCQQAIDYPEDPKTLERIIQWASVQRDIDGRQVDILFMDRDSYWILWPKAKRLMIAYRYLSLDGYEWGYTPIFSITSDLQHFLDLRRNEILLNNENPFESKEKTPWN